MNLQLIKYTNDLLRKNPLINTLVYIKNASLPNVEINLDFFKSFWACRAIMAGGNDYKKGFNQSYVIKAFDTYFSFEDAFMTDHKLLDFFIRMHSEQLSFGKNPLIMISRNVYIFNKLTKDKEFKFKDAGTDYNINLQDLFYKKMGLSILDYFKLTWIINAYLFKYDVFDKQLLLRYVETLYKQLKEKGYNVSPLLLNEEIIDNYLNFLSCDYNCFRSIYNERNKTLDNKYIKSCFNPLNIYPLVKTQTKNYIAPNPFVFTKKAFNLFWFFENNVDETNTEIFRNKIFDKLFEEYVGNYLKEIYGKNKVERIKNYKNRNQNAEFFDWIVEADDAVYLFETKAYSLSVENYQTGSINDQIFKKIIKKPVGQMFKRIQDLKSGEYHKINKFQNKKIIPIGLYFDMPFVGSFFYKSIIEEILNEDKYKLEIKSAIGESNSFDDFADFKYHLLNIDELEIFHGLSSKITLSEFLDKMAQNISFQKMQDELGDETSLVSPLLDKEFEDFNNLIVPVYAERKRLK